MNSNTPKGKFFPPIKTAASFLRSICKSPEVFKHVSPATDIQTDRITAFKDSRHSTHVLKESGVFIERSNSNLLNKDFQNSNFMFKTPQPTSKTFKNFLLPTSLNKLRNLSKTVKKLGSHKSSPKLNFNKIFDFEDTASLMHLEEVSLSNAKIISEQNFSDWFSYMKSTYLEGFDLSSATNRISSEELKSLIKISSQEFIRILQIQNNRMSSLLSEIFQYKKLLNKIKTNEKLESSRQEFQNLQDKIDQMTQMLKLQEENFKEKSDQMQSEISVLKSNIIFKDIEISKTLEDLKRLKANRVFRVKKDLENYNKLLNEFTYYKSLVSNEIKDPCTIRVLSEKSDSVKDLILARLDLVSKSKKQQGTRLSEDQLIEHQMLSTNIDAVFIDQSVQVEFQIPKQDFSCQKLPKTRSQQVATDEIMEIVEEIELEQEQELFKQPSITILNENQEQIAKSLFPRANEISVIEDLNVEDMGNEKPRKRRVNSMYRWREQETKASQTDEKVFVEVIKKEEEEILDWMINDRKSYLSTIQKQIIVKKNELSKVNTLVHQGKSMLLNSSHNDLSRQNSLLSSEESEDFLEGEINYLKSVGIIDGEIEIESWKNGYIYGYGKAKSDVSVNDDLATDKIEGSADEQVDLESIQKPSTKVLFKRQNTKSSKKSTKIQEFSFQSKPSKDLKSLLRQQTHSLKFRFIEEFNNEPTKTILKQAKMSKKMTVKAISSLYTAALHKHTLGELCDLASFTYDDFSARYGHKIVAKKLIDFLSSVLKYPDNRRTINFAKMIGIGQKIGLNDYIRGKETFSFYLDLLTLLQKSNLGIVFNLDETFDYQFIPAIRAVECTKEIMCKFYDYNKISTIISTIESNSHPDPKKINKFGIIDQEFFTEMLLVEVDKYYHEVINNIWMILEIFYFSKNIVKVFKHDFFMITRFLSPDRFHLVVEEMRKVLDDNEKTISVNLVLQICVSCNVLTLKDFNCFCAGFSEDLVLKEIGERREEVERNLVEIFERKGEFEFDDNFAGEWKSRFEWIVKWKEGDWRKVFFLWRVLVKELERLNS